MYYYIELFELSKYKNNLDAPIKPLSTGEKQRCKIIYLLLHNKPIWLLDEITSNVNEELETIILTELKRIQQEEKKLVIHITHGSLNVKYSDYKMSIKNCDISIVKNKNNDLK